jgi:fluoroacetyl-CoA thioesterase
MASEIPAGVTHQITERVTAEMGAPHLGPAGAVLSTPSMIGLMEQCALQAMRPFLEQHEHSVGTKICITHDAAARVNDDVRITVRLKEFTGRRYVWEVEAHGPEGQRLGGGTHERAVVDARRSGGG